MFVQIGVELYAFEHGVEALNGADADLGHRIDAAGLQVLHVVKLGEQASIVGSAEGLELFEGLAAEVAAIYQEQHAACAGKLDEPVDGAAGGVGFAGAGCHLDERAPAAVAKRILEGGDCGELSRPEAERT